MKKCLFNEIINKCNCIPTKNDDMHFLEKWKNPVLIYSDEKRHLFFIKMKKMYSDEKWLNSLLSKLTNPKIDLGW